MAQEQIKPYGGLMLERIVLHLRSRPKNSTIHEIIGRQRVSDTVGGYKHLSCKLKTR